MKAWVLMFVTGCSFAFVQPVRKLPQDGHVSCNSSAPILDTVVVTALIAVDFALAYKEPELDEGLTTTLQALATIPPIIVYGASAIYGTKLYSTCANLRDASPREKASMLTREAVEVARAEDCDTALQIGLRIEANYGKAEHARFLTHPEIRRCMAARDGLNTAVDLANRARAAAAAGDCKTALDLAERVKATDDAVYRGTVEHNASIESCTR